MKEFEPRPYQKAVFEHVKKGNIPPFIWGRRPYSIGVDIAEKAGDHSVISRAYKGHNGKVFMVFDEYANMPDYRWYRHPIKLWRHRRLWKRIMNIPERDTYRLQKTVDKRDTSVIHSA